MRLAAGTLAPVGFEAGAFFLPPAAFFFGLALFFLLEGGVDSADGTDRAASAATFARLRVDTIVENDFVLPRL